jgi:uncharacterized membrane protein
MDKKGDMPFWVIMLIFSLITLVTILIIIGLAGNKVHGFLDWLSGVF